MTNLYARENAQRLAQEGLPPTPGNTYLAHFVGPEGAVNVLRADDDTPIEQVLDAASVAANDFLRGKTVGWLKNWANKKMRNA